MMRLRTRFLDLDNDADCQLLKRIIYQEDKPFSELLRVAAREG
jgi:hypothetical protein